MANTADERSRVLGGLVCLAAVAGGALFLYGIASRSYWALALPLAAAVLFVLSLVFWIGWTILTVRTEASGEPLEIQRGDPGSAKRGPPGAASPAGPGSAAPERS